MGGASYFKTDNPPSLQHMAFENLELGMFECGKYGIPDMLPCHVVGERFERYMDHKRVKDPENVTAHFYYDDYRFIGAWRNPNRWINGVSRFKSVIAPDFSLYTNHPLCLQMLSVYRRAWITRYWQENGIPVIPNVVWGDPGTYEFCFEGVPGHSILAVSSVGVWRDVEWKKNVFADGYNEMLKRCEPDAVLWYGSIDGIEGIDRTVEIIRIPTYYERERGRLNAMRKAARNNG